jgi:hypothetical protein
MGMACLQAVHKMLDRLATDLDLENATLVLQPALLGIGEQGEVSEEAEAKVQSDLVRFYTKNGYQILYHQKPESPVTYMLMYRALADN